MRASMKDVAKHAEVSVATVSHVINNTRFVSEETRKKVMDSIEVLGYVPDPTARSFKTGRKNLIGIVVPDIANPVWAIIIEEAESVLARDGYKLLIVNTKETESREIENLKLPASRLSLRYDYPSGLSGDPRRHLPDDFRGPPPDRIYYGTDAVIHQCEPAERI